MANTYHHLRVENGRSTFDKVVLVFAIIAPFTSIPQVLKVYVEQSAGVSLASWCMYAFFTIPLIIYGFVHRDRVVQFNASLNFLMQVSVVVGVLIYG